MDEVWHRRDLIAPDRLLELSARSDGPGFARAASHAALLATTTLFVFEATGRWRWLAMFCQGLALVSLFAPFHECTHYTAFRTRRYNVVLASICGVLLLLPATFYRLIHFHHHRHTQDLNEDPELVVPKPDNVPGYLLYISGIPYLGFLVGVILLNTTGLAWRQSSAMSEATWPSVVREARMHLAFYAAIAALSVYTRSTVALVYWLVPLTIAQWALNVYLLAEHTGCAYSPDLLENTRTTHTTPAVRFFMWNMPYHAEHHLFPSVPFHALPSLHSELSGRFRYVERGYFAFHRAFVRGLLNSSPASGRHVTGA